MVICASGLVFLISLYNWILICSNFLQVVVQQLNFIERSSPTGLYDRGSNNMEAGKSHVFYDIRF